MRKNLIGFFWGILVLCSPPLLLDAEIIETNEIKVVLEHIENDSMVLFNLTNTLYKPYSTVAEFRWREYFDKRVKELVPQPEIHQRITNQIKNTIVTQIPKKAVDDFTTKIIADLQEQHVVALGITKKEFSTSFANNFGYITHKHLQSLGINFEKTLDYLEVDPLITLPAYTFAHGIIFSNKKAIGPTLLDFLKDLPSKPHQIIYVDNSLQSLETTQVSLDTLKISFCGLNYGVSELDDQNLDYTLGIIELFALLNENVCLSDAEAFQIKLSHPEIDYQLMLDRFILQKAQES